MYGESDECRSPGSAEQAVEALQVLAREILTIRCGIERETSNKGLAGHQGHYRYQRVRASGKRRDQRDGRPLKLETGSIVCISPSQIVAHGGEQFTRILPDASKVLHSEPQRAMAGDTRPHLSRGNRVLVFATSSWTGAFIVPRFVAAWTRIPCTAFTDLDHPTPPGNLRAERVTRERRSTLLTKQKLSTISSHVYGSGTMVSADATSEEEVRVGR